MSIAKYIESRYLVLNCDDNGFLGIPFRQLVRKARMHVVQELVLCPRSYDSSVELLLSDGSILGISNPGELAFPGCMYALSLEESEFYRKEG